jgi:Domain of unknown function (DUF4260)
MDTAVSGTPRVLLRGEGLALLIAAVVGHQSIGGSWMLFAALLLLPDLGLLGYLAGPRMGALTYNAVHTYFGPAILGALAYLDVAPGAWPICLIWMAHIGMDRVLGLGLKFSSDFKNTHLGSIGRAAPKE